jgi:hypothetical protein
MMKLIKIKLVKIISLINKLYTNLEESSSLLTQSSK